MPKEHRPRHGSMGFSPRKRSESPVPHFSSWPEIETGPKLQGFAGYKAGMTHAFVVDYRPTSTTSGQEVQVPVTVIETPPMRVADARKERGLFNPSSPLERFDRKAWATRGVHGREAHRASIGRARRLRPSSMSRHTFVAIR